MRLLTMTKTLTKKQAKLQSISPANGSVVAITISKPEENLISRYSSVFPSSDLRVFVREAVTSTIRWMQRMINGDNLFELETMDHWKYDPEKELLILKDSPSRRKRDYKIIYDMKFARKDVDEYHQGLASILSSYWYKQHATPTTVVELIACCDILYRRFHNDISPASAAGVFHTDLDMTKQPA